ncbi:MAG TPA: DUF6067 family protein [Candidatus Brocadiia bacterium]|nr:DUF6067 family protein [Candidatus Brocadiia bacterium]
MAFFTPQPRILKLSPAAALLALLLFHGGFPLMAQIKAHPEYEPSDPSAFVPANNLFLNAKVAASQHWSDRVPQFAVNGKRDNEGEHWAAENIPVFLTVLLPKPSDINTIRLWTFWNGRRYYQYIIEGSSDGEKWEMLADMRDNKRPAGPDGEFYRFPTRNVSQVRVTFVHNSESDRAGGHIVEIEGYLLGEDQLREEQRMREAWAKIEQGLRGTVASTDVRYPRNEVPAAEGQMKCKLSGWRGERVNAQFVLWSREGLKQLRLSCAPLRSEQAGEIPSERVKAQFVRYTLADGKLMPDIIDHAGEIDIPSASARPVWFSVDIPRDATPGDYRTSVTARAKGAAAITFDVDLEVLSPVLPEPSQWTFHLDLWQNPFAIARFHGVEPWSDAHFAIMEPHMRMLAEAGQKCITTSIVHHPWGTQTFDPYESMIKWIHCKNGSWKYDYAVFDRYVEFCHKCGITKQISCYSMVPWTNSFRYIEEETGDYAAVFAIPGTAPYAEHWGPFLADFAAHLESKGWLGKTAIAMDERPPEMMKPMIKLLRSASPKLKIALAGGNHPELKDQIDDWCVFITPPLDPALAKERTAKGLPTTFYVCCGPAKPNTFTFSPPAESEWQGLYAAAMHYTGFLRWAHDSWVENPFHDTSFVTWPAGDCFFVYPGARTSIRFEMLREGIEGFEKIRILRETLGASQNAEAKAAMEKLEAALGELRYDKVQNAPAAGPVQAVRDAVVAASRLSGK